jgi:hypothetical protein
MAGIKLGQPGCCCGGGGGGGTTCRDLVGPTLCLTWTSQGYIDQISPPNCYNNFTPTPQGPFTATLNYIPGSDATTGGTYLSDFVGGPVMYDIRAAGCGSSTIDTCVYVRFSVNCNTEGLQLSRFTQPDIDHPCGSPETICDGSWTFATPAGAKFGATWNCNPTNNPSFVGFFVNATLVEGTCESGSGGGAASPAEFSAMPTSPNPFAGTS